MTEVLSARELGRATLARQLLLERRALRPVEAVERLCAMQAQEARPPFIGLWSRLRDFDPAALHRALRRGAIVRAPLFRGTLHLASAADWAQMRGVCQPAMDEGLGVLGRRLEGIDVPAVAARARALLRAGPRTAEELRELLAQAFPGKDERVLAFAARMRLAVVMVAGEDEWGFPRDPRFALGAPAPAAPSAVRLAELVRRYLAAFGPASATDAQQFTGLPRLRTVLDGLRDELVTVP